MSTRNIKYNNTTVERVNFNRSQVDVVNFNNVTVYDNSAQEVLFEIYPEFVPHDDTRLQPIISSSESSYVIPEMEIGGNTNFFVRVKNQGAGDVAIASSRVEDLVYKIDNYGYGFFRNVGYCEWNGGSGSGTIAGTTTFTPSTDASLAKTISTYNYYDENNTTFFMGLFTAKLIRVPSSGLSDYLTLLLFPMDFDDKYYCDATKTYTVDVSTVGDYINNALVRSGTVTNVTPSDNGTYVTLGVTDNGLEAQINYTIGQNSTSQYRYAFFHFYRGSYGQNPTSMEGAEVHFIQEPYSENRIYFGNIPKEPKYWEGYARNSSSSLMYHNAFQYTNSTIVTNSVDISMKSSDNTYYRHNVLCVPTSLNCTLTEPYTNNYEVLVNNYYWGTQQFTIYKLAINQDSVYTLTIT